MLSACVLLVSLLYGSAVFAAPSSIRKSKEVVKMNSSQDSSIAGAAYFITNEPTGNFVVTAALKDDGTLTFDKAISTRGLGQHGLTDPVGPDPLFSQGVIKASAASKVLATVNAGSNTVSLFAINETNPTDIKIIGQPASTEGEFPLSLAFNKNGTQACVLNGGAVNNVNCYNVDLELGLIPISNTLRAIGINQTTPATGPAGSASHVIFSEDGTKLIASIKGVPPTPGFFAVWDVASDGTLSPEFNKVEPPTGGLLPFGMTVIPGMNAVLAADAGVGFDVIDLSSVQPNSNSTGSSKDVAVAVGGQKAVCWVAHSAKTGNFYMTDIGTAQVTEVHVDGNLNATIVKQYQQTQGSATTDDEVATIKNQDFLYILQPNATSVAVLRLDGPGDATNVGNFQLKDVAQAAGLTVNANNLAGMATFII
ncbi:hypothetical protein BC835DRAFT_1485497 [Cytidiella melzeri]|nr:hypothetical protein BC835DRAFT_1485497 [Cytidiella melzeri]